MRILIIEDEAPAARRLVSLIKELSSENEILEVIDSIEQSITWFEKNPSHYFLFLDIHLAYGNSFVLFEKCKIKCPVIFSTAYDHYALKAFEVFSIDYLLKPVDKFSLNKAIEKLKSIQLSTRADDIKLLINSLKQSPKEFKQRFLIKVADQLIPIHIEEVKYFWTSEKMVYINCSNNNYLIDYSLDDLEEMLDPKTFFRINRKAIIHIKSIKKISQHFNGRLKLILEPAFKEEVYVSRERVPEFKQWLEKG